MFRNMQTVQMVCILIALTCITNIFEFASGGHVDGPNKTLTEPQTDPSPTTSNPMNSTTITTPTSTSTVIPYTANPNTTTALPSATVTHLTTTVTPHTTIITTNHPSPSLNTIVSSDSTTTASPTTPKSDPWNDRHFDGMSFMGGIICAVGLRGLTFVLWKFCSLYTKRNYSRV